MIDDRPDISFNRMVYGPYSTAQRTHTEGKLTGRIKYIRDPNGGVEVKFEVEYQGWKMPDYEEVSKTLWLYDYEIKEEPTITIYDCHKEREPRSGSIRIIEDNSII